MNNLSRLAALRWLLRTFGSDFVALFVTRMYRSALHVCTVRYNIVLWSNAIGIPISLTLFTPFVHADS